MKDKTIELTEEMLSEVTGGSRERGENTTDNKGLKCPRCGQLIPLNSVWDLCDMEQLICPYCGLVLNITISDKVRKLRHDTE